MSLTLACRQPDWSAFFAPGPEIGKYLERVADKYKVMQYVKVGAFGSAKCWSHSLSPVWQLQHEVISATWDDPAGKWRIKVRRTNPDGRQEVIDDEADLVVSGTGALSRWQWPDIKGLHDFQGDPVLDPTKVSADPVRQVFCCIPPTTRTAASTTPTRALQ